MLQIPAHDASTISLPPGDHLAEWVDVVDQFGTMLWRRQLLEGWYVRCAICEPPVAGALTSSAASSPPRSIPVTSTPVGSWMGRPRYESKRSFTIDRCRSRSCRFHVQCPSRCRLRQSRLRHIRTSSPLDVRDASFPRYVGSNDRRTDGSRAGSGGCRPRFEFRHAPISRINTWRYFDHGGVTSSSSGPAKAESNCE